MLVPSGASASFLTTSSGPRLLALEPSRFERWRGLPRRVGEADARAIVELCEDRPPSTDALGPRGGDGLLDLSGASDLVVQACVADAGREHLPPDWGSNDLSSALERRRPAGATEEVFDLLLALVSNTAQDKPWWLSARFQGSCNYGLLAPESVRALCEGARGISDERSPIAEIVAFLHELSAVGPRWLACTEW